jgi:hypothetical protein
MFLKLTKTDFAGKIEKPIWVNTDNIVSITRSETEPLTYLTMMTDENLIVVKEEPTFIVTSILHNSP